VIGMLPSVLIANRGEISLRIAETAKRLKMQVICVASEADRLLPHAKAADILRVLDGDPRAVYLDVRRIIAVAEETGAACIHPGYGFLSENPDFAGACERAGIAFVGPPASAIRTMGHKHTAKQIMAEAGVPLVPGYQGDDQDSGRLLEEAERIGFPVILKAVAGGGGKGLRRIERREDWHEAFTACRREAEASFGDGRVLVEKYVSPARHIEVQILADQHGHCIHLGERDCSLQRRHQKIIEESPAPGMTEALRAEIGAAAVAAARAVNYCGAGTVEFIAAPDLSSFYFMEMNTRLQVEHRVTEMVAGLDLVEQQFRIAAGEHLDIAQEDVALRGHAVEARLYAEDPAGGFLPQSGTLHVLKWPRTGKNLRIDTGVAQGSPIAPFYDPMIAKLIAYGRNRREAMTRLATALSRTEVAGVRTNQRFLIDLLNDSDVAAGSVDTGFVERNAATLTRSALSEDDRQAAAGAWFKAATPPLAEPWGANWTLAGLPRTAIADLAINGDTQRYRFSGDRSHTSEASYFDPSSQTLFLALDGRQIEVRPIDQLSRRPDAGDGAAQTLAPMTGRIVRIAAKAGDIVAKGDPLIVIEAMKMEHVLRAGFDGKVAILKAHEGSLVQEGTLLCVLEPATPSEGT
jgi:3-methylcrotonyl-CoA carboxylase alpha subunit